MKTVSLGTTGQVPAIAVGCMRWSGLSTQEIAQLIGTSVEHGANFFDHADIYGKGESETRFGAALKTMPLRREDIILQSKCGIRKGFYDQSKEYILTAVDGILRRLDTDYLDVLLIHRPDALVEPEEVAEAFSLLKQSGKVRHFGVSNHKPSQIALLQKYLDEPLVADQLQFSIPVSNMVANGIEVNMDSAGATDRDGSVLDYCRLHDITVQAWSPFQMPNWGGCFIGSEQYPALNEKLNELAAAYDTTPTALSAAWILRHPAGIQVVTGTASVTRLTEIFGACDIALSREDWYALYLAAGHILP